MSREYWTTTNTAGSGTAWYAPGVNPIENPNNVDIYGVGRHFDFERGRRNIIRDLDIDSSEMIKAVYNDDKITWDDINRLCWGGLYQKDVKELQDTQTNLMVHKILKGLLDDDNGV